MPEMPDNRTSAVTDAEVEAAARVIAFAEEYQPNKWPKYASTARRALEAAAVARDTLRE